MKSDFDEKNIFGRGKENTEYAAFFTGRSYLNPLTTPRRASRSLQT